MKKSYITPAFTIIALETQCIMVGSDRITSLSTTSYDGSGTTTDVNLSYDGITHVGIGDGGFLGGK